MEKEIWLPIKGYENNYIISNYGRVKSLIFGSPRGYFVRKKPKSVKSSISNDGYERVSLNIKGKAKKYYVHRLVAETFIPNPQNYPFVNHKDEDTLNNFSSNLEWCTAKYNSNYGTLPRRMSEFVKHSHHTSKPVIKFGLDGEEICRYDSIEDAARELGVNGANISRVCKGKYFTSCGFRWKYVQDISHYQPRSDRHLRRMRQHLKN